MALSAAVTFVGLQTHHVLLEVLFDRLVPRLEDRHQPDATDSGRILNA